MAGSAGRTLHRRHPFRAKHAARSFSRTRSSPMRVHAGVAVQFCVPYQAAFGEELAVVGNQSYLGDWDPQSPAVMTWAEGDIWTYDATVLADTTLEYKYVRRSAGEVVWEEGGNRVLHVDTSKMASVATKDLWEHQESSEVVVTAAGEPAAEAEAGTSAPGAAPAQVPALVQKEEVGGNGVHAASKAAPVSATREMVVAAVSAIADAPPAEIAAAPAPPAVEEEVAAEAAPGPVAAEAAPEDAVEAHPAQEGTAEQGHAGQPCEYLGVALTDVRAMMEKEPGIVLLPYDEA